MAQISLQLITSGLGTRCSQARSRVNKSIVPFGIGLLMRIHHLLGLYEQVHFDNLLVLQEIQIPVNGRMVPLVSLNEYMLLGSPDIYVVGGWVIMHERCAYSWGKMFTWFCSDPFTLSRDRSQRAIIRNAQKCSNSAFLGNHSKFAPNGTLSKIIALFSLGLIPGQRPGLLLVS